MISPFFVAKNAEISRFFNKNLLKKIDLEGCNLKKSGVILVHKW
jgi:hypothetical protein